MRTEEFLRERLYLLNVSPRTIERYRTSLRWLPCESPSQSQLNDVVIRMREKALKVTGCNSVLRGLNAYRKWSGSPVNARMLKEPQVVLPTYTEVQVKRLIAWKPKGKYPRRLHLLVLF
jgi:integrase/recombinase XerD